ncbi:hypothetical protein [Methanoculleus chikugoensis]|uniref:Uncharacterized protein n=1 Tax=Methanoculleus chikugoensis TaxID=118126 RepID=A0ABM7H684_9EURY|nr:hypothetical protein [Methanoculleus chikugoensis]BBL68126.1 hypothetical protein MchiMG62_13070 [Methanoculleus chikugoensis]
MDVRKIAILVILVSLLVGCALAQGTVAQETATVTGGAVTPTTKETVTAGTETPVSPDPTSILLLFLVLLVIGILIILPWLVVTYSNIHLRNTIIADIHNVRDENLRLKYCEMLLVQIPERKGLSRFSLMLAVTLLVGTAVLYLVIKDPNSELLKTIIGVLTGALASIIGFFFGGRAAESASEGARQQPAEKPGGVPAGTSGGVPAGTSGGVPAGTSGGVPAGTSGGVPAGTSGEVPAVKP